MKSQKLTFQYILTRKNVKNINCRIKSDGVVYVSANEKVPLSIIESFLLDNQNKILSAIDKANKSNIYNFNYETLKLLNCEYKIKLFKDPINSISIDKGVIKITTPDTNNTENINLLIDSLLLKLAPTVIEPICIEIYNLIKSYYDIPYPYFKYKKLKSMWGSCRKQKALITFNTKLLYTNEDFLRYVILHEFVHLIHANHQKNFHNVMEFFMPNYKTIKSYQTF